MIVTEMSAATPGNFDSVPQHALNIWIDFVTPELDYKNVRDLCILICCAFKCVVLENMLFIITNERTNMLSCGYG
jgi:hypothetical protein